MIDPGYINVDLFLGNEEEERDMKLIRLSKGFKGDVMRYSLIDEDHGNKKGFFLWTSENIEITTIRELNNAAAIKKYDYEK